MIKEGVLALCVTGVCLSAVAYHDVILTFDNTQSAEQYNITCSAPSDSGNSPKWTVDAGVSADLDVPNDDTNDNNGTTCDIEYDDNGHWSKQYTFYYQVYEKGGWATPPYMERIAEAVNAPNYPLVLCPGKVGGYSASILMNQSNKVDPTTTTTTTTSTVTWKSSVAYSPSLGQAIANEIADRLITVSDRSWKTDDDTYVSSATVTGSYAISNSEFTFVIVTTTVATPIPPPDDGCDTYEYPYP